MINSKPQILQKVLSDNSYQSIFDNSLEGLLLIENNRFIDCTQSIINMMNASSKDDILDLHPSDISPLHQYDNELSYTKAEKMMDACYEHGYHNFEWIHIKVTGEAFWVDVSLTNIYIEFRTLICVLWKDISEKKKHELELQSIQKKNKQLIHELNSQVIKQSSILIKQSRLSQMSKLVSTLAHQWRQPLSSIRSVTNNILLQHDLEKEINKDTIHELIKGMDNNIDILSNYINVFSKIYNQNPERQSIKCSDIVNEAIDIKRPGLDINEIEISTLSLCNKHVLICKGEIIDALLQVLDNAIESLISHKTPKPKILISVMELDRSIRIDICDNGKLIDETIKDQIFDPYFSTKYEKNGKGLGLYIASINIENNHHGKIYIDQDKKMNCICIELPCN